MGDLIGREVSGVLTAVPYEELERVRGAQGNRFERALLFADCCRLNALFMIASAGSGHIGSTFSSLDAVSWLYLEELGPDDLYFSSKGHDAPGLYAVLIGLGRLPYSLLGRLRRLGGLPGHPDVGTPGIVTNTGSLGMGISKAKGLALALRLRGERRRLHVLTGDGELQEGQIWESLGSAVNLGLGEITILVDHNKLQSDTFVEKTSALGDLVAKFEAFGTIVERLDGHDVRALSEALTRTKDRDRPQVLILDTVKGRGVRGMEHTSLDSDVELYRFHSGAPDVAAYTAAVEELSDRIEQRARALGLGALRFETNVRPEAPPSMNGGLERLIPAYSRALVAQMEETPTLVALDADLAVDTGQLPARQRFPERWFECGIAEMDMVSQAGGMALRGLLPVCHSFACFLSARANEQIYNNATERTKVVYVMSLAGLLPAGPGHSHQSLRDVSALAAVPDLVILGPGSESEVALALSWAVNRPRGSSMIRLESVPCVVPYAYPADHRLVEGRGTRLRAGRQALFIGYGPTLLSEACRASELLAAAGVEAGVIALPWLNRVDRRWLAEAVVGTSHLFCLDNHFVTGGQGAFLAAAIAQAGLERPPRLHLVGVEGLPACGTNAEVLRHHGLDADSLAERVERELAGRRVPPTRTLDLQ